MPFGYDHKYVYSEIGFNLKMTDLQAAIGAAQMDKLPDFCQKRRQNFQKQHAIFSQFPDFFALPEATPKSDPAWFSFIVTLKPECPFTRDELVSFLNANRIETRNLFAGNMTKQPAFIGKQWRRVGDLQNTDYIMQNTFFIGTYPGLTDGMFEHIARTLKGFLEKYQ